MAKKTKWKKLRGKGEKVYLAPGTLHQELELLRVTESGIFEYGKRAGSRRKKQKNIFTKMYVCSQPCEFFSSEQIRKVCERLWGKGRTIRIFQERSTADGVWNLRFLIAEAFDYLEEAAETFRELDYTFYQAMEDTGIQDLQTLPLPERMRLIRKMAASFGAIPDIEELGENWMTECRGTCLPKEITFTPDGFLSAGRWHTFVMTVTEGSQEVLADGRIDMDAYGGLSVVTALDFVTKDQVKAYMDSVYTGLDGIKSRLQRKNAGMYRALFEPEEENEAQDHWARAARVYLLSAETEAEGKRQVEELGKKLREDNVDLRVLYHLQKQCFYAACGWGYQFPEIGMLVNLTKKEERDGKKYAGNAKKDEE